MSRPKSYDTVIAGYRVTVTSGAPDDSGVNGCWISKGRFSSSLAVLDDFGMIADEEGTPCHSVPASVQQKIREFASQHGYD